MHGHLKLGQNSVRNKVWRVAIAKEGIQKQRIKLFLSFRAPYRESNETELK